MTQVQAAIVSHMKSKRIAVVMMALLRLSLPWRP